jgi:hypothetical protein
MPIVRMPNGDQVRFPDDLPKEKIREFIAKKFPDAYKGKEVSTGEAVADTVTGLGAGLTDAAISVGELPADMASGARWLADKAGVPQDYINKGAAAAKSIPFLGGSIQASQALRNEMDAPTTGVGKGLKAYREYDPKTTTGDYAKTIGEFAGGAIGNKAGLLTRAGKYALLPALGSETAGQLTEGSDWEPYARAAGGLLGLGTGAGTLNSLGERGFKKAMSTADDVKKAGHAAYEEAKNANVIIRTSTIDKMRAGLAQHLDDLGFLPGNQTKANNVLNEVLSNLDRNPSRLLAGRGNQTGFGQKPLNLWELDNVSQRIGNQIKGLNPTDAGDRRILWAAKHYIDDFATNLSNKDIMAGDLNRGVTALKKAKEYWTKKSKLELLDQLEEKAGETGKARYTRGGVEHATRSEFLKFLRKDPNKRQRLTKDELKKFQRVSHGTTIGNAARDFGKQIAGFGGLGGAGTGIWAGGLLGGPVGAMLGAAGTFGGSQLAKLMARRSTQRAANDARGIIANNGVMPKRHYNSNIGRILTGNQILNGN